MSSDTSRRVVTPLGAVILILLLALMSAQPARAQTVIPLPTVSTTGTVLPPFPPPPTQRPNPDMNRAGVVVRYSNGEVVTRCVHFVEQQIGGDELLERSGLAPTISTYGEVCAISGDGCPVDDCFCKCPFPECEYWGYFHLSGTAWRYSEVGPSGWSVQDGEVDGWSWGSGDFTQGLPPPVITFEQICPPADVTPMPTSTPMPTHQGYTPPPATFTPIPTPAATPAPPPVDIPEPGTLALVMTGALGLAAWVLGTRGRSR
jgi:hypothetical protein